MKDFKNNILKQGDKVIFSLYNTELEEGVILSLTTKEVIIKSNYSNYIIRRLFKKVLKI